MTAEKTDHLFKTRKDDSGRCAVCGEYWEHPNHKAEHRARPSRSKV